MIKQIHNDDQCIDVVYTWVDPTHQEWLEQKNAAKGHSSFANNQSRYNSNLNELKYSLRSLQCYFSDYIRRIYVVTNHGAVPAFLDDTRDDVVIIDDRDLLGHESYCSCVFESVLHRIPGITENFLYMNDDMFLNKPLSLDDVLSLEGSPIWYQDTDRVVRFFNRYPALSRFFDVDGYVALAREHTFKRLGVSGKMPGPIGHCCRLLNTQLLADFEARFQSDIDALRRTLFRSKDIFCFLDAYCYYFWSQKKLEFSRSKRILLLLQTDRWSDLLNKWRLRNLEAYDFFCISDLRKYREDACSYLASFLQQRFPGASQWEC